MRSSATRITGAWCVISGNTPQRPRPRFRRAAAGRWIGRCCTGRRTHCTVLIPTTTSSGWITKSGTADFARKCSGKETPGRTRLFSAHSERNQEWVDLELLLRELNELGARPLLLSMPIHGGWYDQCGVTYTARRAYYQKLREIGARYHAAVVDFADHDADQSFCHDTMGHLAPSGLVYYNQVLDGFFHDAIPRQPELPAPAPVASRGTGAGLQSRPAPGSRPPSEGFHDPSAATAIRDRASRTNPEPTLQGRKGKP